MLRFQYNFIPMSDIIKWGIFSAKSGYFYYAIHINEAEMEQDPAAAKAEELEASLPDKTGKKRKARTTDAERFKGIPVQKKYLDIV